MLKKKIFAVFYVLLIVAILAGCSSGGSGNVQISSSGKNVSLAWIAPTTNTDKSQITDLAGYKVYYGTASGNYSKILNVGNVLNYTVISLPPGTYYFAITCYNSYGSESNYSNEVSTTII